MEITPFKRVENIESLMELMETFWEIANFLYLVTIWFLDQWWNYQDDPILVFQRMNPDDALKNNQITSLTTSFLR